jgi:putative iron-dependent peroxidase
MGVGYDAWLQLNLPFPLPKELENFVPVVGDKHTAVSTKGDLHFHIRGNDSSVCFDMAYEISDIMKQAATSIEEIHGFRYWGGRSTFGFVDGTENPHEEERAFFGLVGNDDPVYRGVSYLFVQKYIHDLNAFKKLSTEEQEKVYGSSERYI